MATCNSLLAFRVGVLLGGARQGDSAGFDKTRWERKRQTESLPKRDDCNCQFSFHLHNRITVLILNFWCGCKSANGDPADSKLLPLFLRLYIYIYIWLVPYRCSSLSGFTSQTITAQCSDLPVFSSCRSISPARITSQISFCACLLWFCVYIGVRVFYVRVYLCLYAIHSCKRSRLLLTCSVSNQPVKSEV